MSKTYKIFLGILLLCTSCFNREGNIIDVNTIDEEIYIGMSKEKLIQEIGLPKDSLSWGNPNNKEYYFLYNTNDITGYTLKVKFTKTDRIEFYRID